MKKLLPILAAGVLATALAAGSPAAQGEKGVEKSAESSMYTAEEMAAWQAAGTPGPHHTHFKDLVGRWNAECTMWSQPGSEPQTAALTAEYKLLFDGRYLLQNIDGVMMGMPFHGMAVSGYDNVKGVHTMVWFDNMSTSTAYSEGQCTDNCQVETHHRGRNGQVGHALCR
ncbi:MAG: DUF1579 family protein [bacterium]